METRSLRPYRIFLALPWHPTAFINSYCPNPIGPEISIANPKTCFGFLPGLVVHFRAMAYLTQKRLNIMNIYDNLLSNLFDQGGSFLIKRETLDPSSWSPSNSIQVLQQIRIVLSTDIINTIALYPIGPKTSSYTLILRAAHHQGSLPSMFIPAVWIDPLPGGNNPSQKAIIDYRAPQLFQPQKIYNINAMDLYGKG